jgi:hypothetical protein
MATAVEKKYTLNELKLGMNVSASQLSNIYDTYMIIAYSNQSDKIGELVYVGNTQNDKYEQWFNQTRPITPIYNSKEELEDLVVYDE